MSSSEADAAERERLAAQELAARDIAHELNNSLAAIVAFSHLLRSDERLPQDLRDGAALLAQEADRTRRIAQNLLDFVQPRPPERERPPAVDDDDRAAGPPTVLVIDDEPAIRALLTKILRVGGFDPSAVQTGDDAVALIRERTFDAVLVDQRMTGMTGIEVYEAVTAIRPELGSRFVIISGDMQDRALRGFADERRIALLAKPFDVEDVLRVVRAVTGQRRSRG